MSNPILEPAAREFADAVSKPPFPYELGAEGARKVLDDVQAAPVAMPEVTDKWITVPAEVGDVRVRIVKPAGTAGALPAVLYVHGGGWVLGNAGTHDRLVRELATGTGAAIVFVEYDRSPEARYPVAIEQAYAAGRWITEHGAAEGLDASRLAVAGDSVGGNMTAALAILAKRRGDVTFVHQSMYYPVTDAGQDTASYREFADGPHLTAKAMAWFWDAYAPDLAQRTKITASPLRATLRDLDGLPPAFLIVDENDVLRDEGEAYARRLTEAGVPTTSVRYNGTLHDFMMLNPVRDTNATRGATAQAIDVLKTALRKVNPMSTEPVIALVHGAFAESASWNRVIERLNARGLDAVAIGNPLRSVSGDGAYVRDVVNGLGCPVILVGHSYGGMVISEAAAGDPAVRALVYVAGFAPDPSETALLLSGKFEGSTLGEALTPYPLTGGGNEFRITDDKFHQQFCADLDTGEAALMAATQRPVTEKALTDGLSVTEPAWRTKPSWFVFGEEDRNIPAALMHFMADRAASKGTQEVPGASHALAASAPDPVCATILEAAAQA